MPVRVGLKYIEEWKESMEDEVLAYEKCIPEKNKIVFYGPSNFTRWSKKWGMVPLEECILGKSGKQCAINRGFGSTCAEHQLYYYPRMIRPLEPKVLVYSPFGNYSAFGYSVEEVWQLAQRVMIYAKTDFPDIRIYICGPKPNKKTTEKLFAQMQEFEKLSREFTTENKDFYYIDCMQNPEFGRDDIYVEDGVHFNQEGYNIYTKFFLEALKDELAEF